MPQYLSEHFPLSEFTRSKTASRLGIDNTPSATVIENAAALCVNVLEPIRTYFRKKYPDKKPVIVISSGFRCPTLNKAEGGAVNSQHLFGEAADIEIPGIRNDELWQAICDYGVFDQVIAEHLRADDGSAGWVHVSYRAGQNRKQALSCVAKDVYVPGLQYAR